MLRSRSRKGLLLACALLGLLLLVYLNYFHNGFQYDDMHTVVTNPYIRDLRYIPRFFTDARTFSVSPANRSYRPLVSASLALDYWTGKGLDPFYFRLSTFCWFLVQLTLMVFLFRRICDRAWPDPRNALVAVLATAVFAIHPAIAETVNYVIQRGDLYSTLGVVAGVLIYAAAPRYRRFGLYLLPVAAALLSKPPAMVFPAILFVYIFLFEEEAAPGRARRALIRALPALAMTAALGVLQKVMTPREFDPGAPPAYAYLITQPLVALRYFRTFFAPGGLAADTGFTAVSSVWKGGAWAGFLFLAAMIAAAVACSRRNQLRPTAFGLWWFLLALIPTSVFPLAEVENCHRMFFPFVGLTLAVSWPVALWVYQNGIRKRVVAGALAGVCVMEFLVLAVGTMNRNLVWKDQGSLWRDVTVKYPLNPRGHLNYGNYLAEKGDYPAALAELETGLRLQPSNALLHLNRAAVFAKLHRDSEADQEFRLTLAMPDGRARYTYGSWLDGVGREDEAIKQLVLADKQNPDYLDPCYKLCEIFARRGSWETVWKVADRVLQRFPEDTSARTYALMASSEGGLNTTAPGRPLRTADTFLSLSAAYYKAGKYSDSIAAATEAVRLHPGYAEAYNNISAANRALEKWDEASEAARRALHIRSSYRPAQQNLLFAQQKRK